MLYYQLRISRQVQERSELGQDQHPMAESEMAPNGMRTNKSHSILFGQSINIHHFAFNFTDPNIIQTVHDLVIIKMKSSVKIRKILAHVYIVEAYIGCRVKSSGPYSIVKSGSACALCEFVYCKCTQKLNGICHG